MGNKIINPKQVYSYYQLCSDLNRLATRYANQLSLSTIGYSAEGRRIFAVKVGKGHKKLLCHGAHHAREWLTSALIVDLIETLFTDQDAPWKTLREKQLDQLALTFVPMVNPDGVTLVQEGASGFPHHKDLIAWNEGSTDFRSWKANSRGVDLNRQYPVGWEDIQQDPGEPKSSHYKGKKPLSEPEVQALYRLAEDELFDCAIAYHSSGEEIFWRYNLQGDIIEKYRPLAEGLAKLTGYRLIEPGPNPSGGGFTDWFLTSFQKPCFTIEIAPSVGPKPVPLDFYDQIYHENKDVIPLLGKYLIDNKK
ncbi:M14 family metallopeptidase [Amphibacillus sediminis]|uniref:M14 family metallopeptidase n=1 Tax=Amphibacillus sediminis TaxID=360185 RepID=UPI000833790F|nr:M14 family metallocarboxypeptidase [Amphibacillus sediminis]